MRSAVRLLLGLVTVAAVLFLFVFPVRTLIDQRHATGLAEKQVTGLQTENKLLAKQAQELKDPAYIKRIANQRYGLTAPGQREVIVVPATTTTAPTTTTTTAPTTTTATAAATAGTASTTTTTTP